MMRFLALLCALLAFAAAVPAAALTGRASVVDGDTIEIHGQCIRLSGIHCKGEGVRDGVPSPSLLAGRALVRRDPR